MSLLILSALYFLSLKEEGEKTAVIKDVGGKETRMLKSSSIPRCTLLLFFFFFVTASLRCLTSESLVEVAVMLSFLEGFCYFRSLLEK